jgi:hypothetical protein
VIYRVFVNDEDYVVIDADSPEEAMLKLRDAGLEPVKAEPYANKRTESGVRGSASLTDVKQAIPTRARGTPT